MNYNFDEIAAHLPDHELPTEAQHRHLDALMRLSQPAATAPSLIRRPKLLAGVAALVTAAAAVTTAASMGAFSAPVRNHDTAHCYTTADLSRGDNHNDFGVAVSGNDAQQVGDAAAQAMEICSSEWAKGRFSTTTPTFLNYVNGPATHPVPKLTACVLDNGEVAIVPGVPTVCGSLGLGNATGL